MRSRFLILLMVLISLPAGAQELPAVKVDYQPFAADVVRVLDALDEVGNPLPAGDAQRLRALAAGAADPAKAVAEMQQILDRYCLVDVVINPESRVHVVEGPATPELVEQGWRVFLVKVANQAGVTAVLRAYSPNAGELAGTNAEQVASRFLDLWMFDKQPMRERLSGLELEYRVLALFSRDAGKREAKLAFDVGQGTQDLGFRNEVDILFTARPATKVTLHVHDTDGKPTTASFTIRDARALVYPSQAKRLAPDFAFQPQIYRKDGEFVLLPAGDYTFEVTRGPEYLTETRHVKIGSAPTALDFKLARWIDPAKLGWYSGDHHIHAAGCAHYEKPTEGVYPKDMMRHILGEDLNVGEVLSWGPGWYFQKTFFEGKPNALSTDENVMRYDVEVSGFPSSHSGHLCLLGLKDQDYEGTRRIEDWPTYGIPILRWAKAQGAVVGYAHSGWGLALKEEKLPSEEIPPFDGIGANEYIVSVTEGLPDFISTMDTPYAWELNIWYHTLNVGFRTRISGETDFPCIYGERVGIGRSYVREQGELSYPNWLAGVRAGRNYVSDGRSHLLNFKVNDVELGEGASELKLDAPGEVTVKADVAALLTETPDAKLDALPYTEKPYWDLERARVGQSRTVPLEVVVNGQPVARQKFLADGKLRPASFTVKIDQSSWVALRILPSSHTNPVFVLVGGKPIRASRKSAEWCLKSVDQCWSQKSPKIRAEELPYAQKSYDHARAVYQKLLSECAAD